MENTPFLQLRSAYLRAVAKSWSDDTFRAKLLERSKFERNKSERDRGAIQLLVEKFGLQFPWNLRLQVRDLGEAMSLQWLDGQGWRGPKDQFTIYLPVPSTKDEETKVEGLKHLPELVAAYYQRRPALLEMPLDGQWPGDSEGGIPPEFADFGGVLIRALSQVLHDDYSDPRPSPSFGSQFFTDPQEFVAQIAATLNDLAGRLQVKVDEGTLLKASKELFCGASVVGIAEEWLKTPALVEHQSLPQVLGDVCKTLEGSPEAWMLWASLNKGGRALTQCFGYNCPWNFHIMAIAHEVTYEEGNWCLDDLPFNTITLNLPQLPKWQTPAVQCVALAAYNNTGAAYPFTCL